MYSTVFIWQSIKLIFLFICLAFATSSCEAPVTIDIPTGTEKIVVEGYIEQDAPPLVILTKSAAYFEDVSLSSIQRSFVNGAVVKISDGTNTITLQEVASDTLPLDIKNAIGSNFNINFKVLDSLGFTFYFYTSIQPTAFGKLNTAYHLSIQYQEQMITATTTIPALNMLDSVWTVPDTKNDSLHLLFVRYTDNPDERNFVRYFTKRNSEPFFAGYFNSVFDDRGLFNVEGKTFDFSLERGYDRTQNIDLDTYAYFRRGDTIRLRWCAIDEIHHAFWRTLEFDRNNQGNPFGASTRIQSNIKGGLGIWGGYAATYKTIIIP
jgi:hypothetical protein